MDTPREISLSCAKGYSIASDHEASQRSSDDRVAKSGISLIWLSTPDDTKRNKGLNE